MHFDYFDFSVVAVFFSSYFFAYVLKRSIDSCWVKKKLLPVFFFRLLFENFNNNYCRLHFKTKRWEKNIYPELRYIDDCMNHIRNFSVWFFFFNLILVLFSFSPCTKTHTHIIRHIHIILYVYTQHFFFLLWLTSYFGLALRQNIQMKRTKKKLNIGKNKINYRNLKSKIETKKK